jgi:hypothetical protein
MRRIFCALTLSLVLGQAVRAAETIAYSYDAKGRLVRVVRSGAVNNGVVVDYTHDKADNRTNVKVVGSTNP